RRRRKRTAPHVTRYRRAQTINRSVRLLSLSGPKSALAPSSSTYTVTKSPAISLCHRPTRADGAFKPRKKCFRHSAFDGTRLPANCPDGLTGSGFRVWCTPHKRTDLIFSAALADSAWAPPL